MTEKSLNDQTLRFIIEFEKSIPYGTRLENKKLVELFRQSSFYNRKFDTYIVNAINKAIWYAIKRSGNWSMERGVYIKGYIADQNVGEVTIENTPDPNRNIVSKGFISDSNRDIYIKHLSVNLYNVLMLKKHIDDEVLKAYHLSAKGIGDDLYYLTESYYRQLGVFKGKHSMSDFITPKAKMILDTGQISKKLMYEHMVPKNLYIGEIAQATKMGDLREERINELLSNYYYVCTVTIEEDKILPSIKMHEDWDSKNPFHRYEKAGITFFSNVERYA
ncbi:hypothetical protein [Neobacillus citreus]|uniref:Uncharacterized protein n=1 Tax=Neobacillus citreus TaxID=2833578 RepID=A0A942T7R4_9BACI|nr:hypothetical protein [Neobacillus citreus]MCH6265073.1 hypothetical protein [Neobacillus citreus]